eukprot:2769601-Lingulodinium_polyedra.AAC.1
MRLAKSGPGPSWQDACRPPPDAYRGPDTGVEQMSGAAPPGAAAGMARWHLRPRASAGQTATRHAIGPA